MRGRSLLPIAILILSSVCWAAKPLEIYFIDVEGGQATLIVSPSGQSMLVDAGWPGHNGRDAERIVKAAKASGLKRIDYLVVTHYHTDHVGGVPEVAARFPVVNYVDHGPNTESGKQADALWSEYEKVRAKARHMQVKPGDRLPLTGLDLQVLASGGELVPAISQKRVSSNPLCEGAQKKEDDPTENARSIGFLLRYGNFRFIDLGDLTWNKELQLACPNNPAGKVDVYLSTHHGLDASNPPAIVHSLAPRVAIMNNGARKGGSPSAWRTMRESPGLEDLWQLHFAVAGGAEANSPEQFIANPEEQCSGHWLKLTAHQDGSFEVTNARNGFMKSYPAKR